MEVQGRLQFDTQVEQVSFGFDFSERLTEIIESTKQQVYVEIDSDLPCCRNKHQDQAADAITKINNLAVQQTEKVAKQLEQLSHDVESSLTGIELDLQLANAKLPCSSYNKCREVIADQENAILAAKMRIGEGVSKRIESLSQVQEKLFIFGR